MASDIFPVTQATLLRSLMARGIAGRPDLNNYLMRVYARPLKLYLLGSSYRNLGEPDEIVNEYFVSRFSRLDFLDKWRESGLPLRKWLRFGLLYYAKELIRKDKRQRFEAMESEPAVEAPSVDDDREWPRSVVRAALEIAEETCRTKKLELHWKMFLRYHFDGVPCNRLATESISAEKAWVMVRTAQRHFVTAIREVVAADIDDPDKVDEEIRSLLR